MNTKKAQEEIFQFLRNGRPVEWKDKKALAQAAFQQAKFLIKKEDSFRQSGPEMEVTDMEEEAGEASPASQEPSDHLTAMRVKKSRLLSEQARTKEEEREFLRRAMLWSEILGEPACKRRKYGCRSNAGGGRRGSACASSEDH